MFKLIYKSDISFVDIFVDHIWRFLRIDLRENKC